MTKAILYSDLNCPFCYALEERLVALNLMSQIEWRGVQHSAGLQVPMQIPSLSESQALEKEVLSVRNLAPEIEINFPVGKPNTLRAILSVIAATEKDSILGQIYRHTLAREFWVNGNDISDSDVLNACAESVGLNNVIIDSKSEGLADRWQREWEALPVQVVPVLVLPDGTQKMGLAESTQLTEFLKTLG